MFRKRWLEEPITTPAPLTITDFVFLFFFFLFSFFFFCRSTNRKTRLNATRSGQRRETCITLTNEYNARSPSIETVDDRYRGKAIRRMKLRLQIRGDITGNVFLETY